MAAVTIFALVSYAFMPEERWLPRNRITNFIDSKGALAETVEEISPSRRRNRAQGDATGDNE